LIGGTSSVFLPAICAMSLGIVGRAAFDTRQGPESDLQLGRERGCRRVDGRPRLPRIQPEHLLLLAAFAVPTILVLLLIRPGEIDYELARGANDGEKHGKAESVWLLFRDRALVLFLVCAVMFHFVNAAMLPLLGEMLAKGHGRSSMLFMSVRCNNTIRRHAARVLVGTEGRDLGAKAASADRIRRTSDAWRSLHLTSNTVLLVAIQTLDDVAAAIFGVVSVVVIADLTRGTGRFNLTLGAITTAVGIGAALSQVIAGSIVHHVGSRAGFLFLAGMALAALAILYFFMPETRNTRLATE
jgi:MFS family permease